jgi:hypothetical protein
MLLGYCQNDFEMILVAPVISCITFAFTFHIRCFSIVRSLYYVFSFDFLITILSPALATPVKCSFFIITAYDMRFTDKDGSVGLQLSIYYYYYY